MLWLGLFGVLHHFPWFCSRWGCSVEEFVFLAKFGPTSRLGAFLILYAKASIPAYLTGEYPDDYGLSKKRSVPCLSLRA